MKKKLSEKIIARQRSLVGEMLAELVPHILEKGHPADRVLARFFKQHRELGSRDRRFLSETFFSYFRWLGWTRPLNLDLTEAASLSVHLDLTEIHPALESDRWPVLSDKTLDEKLAALNELFQGLEKESGPNGKAFQPLEKSDLVFPEFGKSVEFPAETESLFYETLQTRPPTWLRLRNDIFKKMLSEAGIPFEQHPQLENAVSIPAGRSLGALGHGGQFEVQDVASQAVVAIAAPEKGSDWWDACAGAGGKTLQMADVIGSSGKVLATDVREQALKEMKKRARTDGISFIRSQPHDLAKDDPFTKQWDGVVVDAPCSGWGTWSRNPDARWRSDPRDPAQKRNLQVRMLNNAAQCVKPGGLLIYAVCTFTREETTEALERFLESNPEFAPEAFANPLSGEPTNGTLQIWPWDGPGDGMFIARLRRTASE
ncbi:RsmB/NOP family class I SAM-dependent RNA methyltransferase [Tichowtungia aerotolerans]|uniref:Class I SAM-dependent methyltransferase n=1 Tax=Tichowtungia aerotolerans TaxID=2697043 RepID=A0A6P1MD97_9BACT|nr:RsmB/NOP family class I SAM-dependent RNA methyltransferase [Tichowtungia aerotolerans]QHI69075.1 class I SAM-dependent methyltransferase [Tichowtungia aerotolerans]